MPGDPLDNLIGTEESVLTHEEYAELYAKMGLDKPLHEQFGMYVKTCSRASGAIHTTKAKTWDECLQKRSHAHFKLQSLRGFCPRFLPIGLGLRQDTRNRVFKTCRSHPLWFLWTQYPTFFLQSCC